MHSSKLNILVIGNNPVLRRGVVEYLDVICLVRIVRGAAFNTDLPQILAESAWNLIVLDVDGEDHLDTLRWLKLALPEVPVLVLNTDNGSPDRASTLAAGATGYLTKNSAVEEWRRAIETVAAGGRYPAGDIPRADNLNAAV